MTTLDKVENARYVKLDRIEGGHRVRQRLTQLGIHVGDVVFVKRGGSLGGPILISSNNSDIAIGRGMAGKIYVTYVKETQDKN